MIKPYTLRKIIFRRKISKSVSTSSTYFQVISCNPSREERLLFSVYAFISFHFYSSLLSSICPNYCNNKGA